MTEKKQIEEMAKDVCQCFVCTLDQYDDCGVKDSGKCYRAVKMAEKLTTKGYRKASEVAREVADGIINEILPKHLHGHNEKALELSFAISNFITNHKEWRE